MATVEDLWQDLCELTKREAGFAALMNPAYNAIIQSEMDWFQRLPLPHDEFELQQRYITHIQMVEDWSNKARQESGDPSRGRLRVLIVDDNADAARLLSMLVQFLGHEVKTAYDGVEGVREAENFQPNIVLMDLTMPRMNGYDAAREIRTQPWGQQMMLVALTGREEEEVRHAARQAGFDQHLVKPISPDALKQLLTAATS